MERLPRRGKLEIMRFVIAVGVEENPAVPGCGGKCTGKDANLSRKPDTDAFGGEVVRITITLQLLVNCTTDGLLCLVASSKGSIVKPTNDNECIARAHFTIPCPHATVRHISTAGMDRNIGLGLAATKFRELGMDHMALHMHCWARFPKFLPKLILKIIGEICWSGGFAGTGWEIGGLKRLCDTRLRCAACIVNGTGAPIVLVGCSYIATDEIKDLRTSWSVNVRAQFLIPSSRSEAPIQ